MLDTREERYVEMAAVDNHYDDKIDTALENSLDKYSDISVLMYR